MSVSVLTAPFHTSDPVDPRVFLPRLRRACRAMAGMLPEVFNDVTPDRMRQVLLNRGWVYQGTAPWPGDPNRVAFELYDNATAQGTDRNYIIKYVRLPMDPTAGDWRNRVGDWATAVSIRHGDVSTAEILAEAL